MLRALAAFLSSPPTQTPLVDLWTGSKWSSEPRLRSLRKRRWNFHEVRCHRPGPKPRQSESQAMCEEPGERCPLSPRFVSQRSQRRRRQPHQLSRRPETRTSKQPWKPCPRGRGSFNAFGLCAARRGLHGLDRGHSTCACGTSAAALARVSVASPKPQKTRQTPIQGLLGV